MFILDLDGTLMNGSAPVPGAALATHKILLDESKKVLFFTNGGYSNVQYNMDKTIEWL